MDAVVLAAGRNDRLRGIVPAFHKPLILMNGRPLVATLVSDALDVVNGRVVVVVAPQNALQITEVLGPMDAQGRVRYVVQSSPSGPAQATRLGLEVCEGAAAVMVLCGDNVVPIDDMRRAQHGFGETGETTICIAKLQAAEAERFTRVTHDRLIEREPIGPIHPNAEGVPFNCWLGPVVAPRDRLLWFLRDHPRTELLSQALSQSCAPFHTVHGDSKDIGVPEALA